MVLVGCLELCLGCGFPASMVLIFPVANRGSCPHLHGVFQFPGIEEADLQACTSGWTGESLGHVWAERGADRNPVEVGGGLCALAKPLGGTRAWSCPRHTQGARGRRGSEEVAGRSRRGALAAPHMAVLGRPQPGPGLHPPTIRSVLKCSRAGQGRGLVPGAGTRADSILASEPGMA